MRTRERVTLAMLVVAGVLASVLAAALASAGPRVQGVLTVAVITLLAVPLFRLDRTGGAMKSGIVSGGHGISAGHPVAVGVSAHRSPVTVRRKPDWDSARGPRPHGR